MSEKSVIHWNLTIAEQQWLLFCQDFPAVGIYITAETNFIHFYRHVLENGDGFENAEVEINVLNPQTTLELTMYIYRILVSRERNRILFSYQSVGDKKHQIVHSLEINQSTMKSVGEIFNTLLRLVPEGIQATIILELAIPNAT